MRRLGFAAVLCALAVMAGGCEEPDFSTVKFRPPRVDPKAFKTAFRAYVFVRQPEKLTWGNEFLYHSRSLPEREFAPLAGTTVLLDEAVPLVTDDAGLVARDSMQEGFHTLRFKYNDVSYASHFRMKREQVTLVICELRPGGVLASSATLIPHSFLTVLPFKRLLAFHHGMDKVLGLYESASGGKHNEKWRSLLADDYSDSKGGKEDFLRALAFRSAQGEAVHVLGRQGELTEKSAYVVAELKRAGNPDFVRLELKGTHDGAWRITSIQD